MVNYQKGREKLQEINNYQYRKNNKGRMNKKQTFEEKHRRVTIYLAVELYETIQSMRETGAIPNLTEFFNNAAGEYIGQYEKNLE